MRFSANLGFLWTDRPLPDRIHAAKAAGFDAVECHWPYDTPSGTVARALRDTGLPMLALNTRPGDLAAGEFGLCALPGRETEAREAIDDACDYAAAIGAGAVHVMAGKGGDMPTFHAALAHACDRAGALGLRVLIEPLNAADAPGYLLSHTDQAAQIIGELARPELAMMFDCYHVARTEGDVLARFTTLRAMIGHVQIAAVPDRGPPDHGALDYAHLLPALRDAGWSAPIGAEYKPDGPTDQSLGWMAAFRG